MQFVKTHMVSLIAGVVGLAAIVAAILGMRDDSVTQKMEDMVRQAQPIRSLSSSLQNERTIDAAERHKDRFLAEYESALEELYNVNRRDPLIDGVFPEPQNMSAGFEFIAAYRDQFPAMRARLDAGTRPTESEISDAETDIREKLRMQQAQEGDGGDLLFSGAEEQQRRGGGASPATRGGGGNPYADGGGAANPYARGNNPYTRGPGGNPYARGPGGGNPYARGPGGGSVNVPDAEREKPENDPKIVAAVNKASSIRIYVDDGALHQMGIIQAERVPPVEELWYAQQSLWIQQDVIAAIAALNERFAGRVDGQANVLNLPVKRLEYVRVNGYKLEEGTVPFPPAIEAGPGGGGGTRVQQLEQLPPTFTGRTSNEEFDVIHFSMAVWVDQRYVLQLVDAISRENLYQCVDMDLQAIQPHERPEGFFFGAAPIMRVTLDFEGYFARSVYKQWMPEEIAVLVGAIEGSGQSQ